MVLGYCLTSWFLRKMEGCGEHKMQKKNTICSEKGLLRIFAEIAFSTPLLMEGKLLENCLLEACGQVLKTLSCCLLQLL